MARELQRTFRALYQVDSAGEPYVRVAKRVEIVPATVAPLRFSRLEPP